MCVTEFAEEGGRRLALSVQQMITRKLSLAETISATDPQSVVRNAYRYVPSKGSSGMECTE
jgi:hypothetical protein